VCVLFFIHICWKREKKKRRKRKKKKGEVEK